MAFVECIRQQGGEDLLRSVMDYWVTNRIGESLQKRRGERQTPYKATCVRIFYRFGPALKITTKLHAVTGRHELCIVT